jgi:hypothetical protein
MKDLATKAIHSGQTDKMVTSINTKEGYIEFRSPGGDWLDENFDKIENTLAAIHSGTQSGHGSRGI